MNPQGITYEIRHTRSPWPIWWHAFLFRLYTRLTRTEWRLRVDDKAIWDWKREW